MAAKRFSTEDELTRWLARRAPAIGDDAAFLPPLGATAVTVDSQREGVHFPTGTPVSVIARRLLAVNLSDLAAVGARPRHALCTLAAPRDFDRRRFFQTLLDACALHGIELVGGDLSTSRKIESTLTAVGTRIPRGRFLRRSNAKPGHDLWLAGYLGESALGYRLMLAGAQYRDSSFTLPNGLPRASARYARHCLQQHICPTAQLAVGQWLARRRSPIAAIDISDGLSRDLGRLAANSKVGLCLEESAIAATAKRPAFDRLCRHLDVDPLQLQLNGGEDYALAFTATPELARSIVALNSIAPITRIGAVTRRTRGNTIHDGEHERTLDTSSGWDHLS